MQSDVQVKGICDFLWPACLSGKDCSLLSSLMLEHYESFLSNLVPPNCATLAAQETCRHLMALLPLMLGAGKAEQLRNSSRPLSLSSWYLNIWRSDIRYFLNVPFSPFFPKVLYFSPVMSWDIWLQHCSRSNVSEQHIPGPGAWKVGLCERYL